MEIPLKLTLIFIIAYSFKVFPDKCLWDQVTFIDEVNFKLHNFKILEEKI